MSVCNLHEACGCEHAHCCLNCPLPVCKYDDPDWARHERTARRDDLILQRLGQPGLTKESVAKEFHLSLRTLQRIRETSKKT